MRRPPPPSWADGGDVRRTIARRTNSPAVLVLVQCEGGLLWTSRSWGSRQCRAQGGAAPWWPTKADSITRQERTWPERIHSGHGIPSKCSVRHCRFTSLVLARSFAESGREGIAIRRRDGRTSRLVRRSPVSDSGRSQAGMSHVAWSGHAQPQCEWGLLDQIFTTHSTSREARS